MRKLITLSCLLGVYYSFGQSLFLDTGFATNGIASMDASFAGNESRIEDIKVQSDGKILVAVSLPTEKDFQLLRYNADGNLDPTFGNNGVVRTDIGFQTLDDAQALEILADGKILVAGGSGNSLALVKYNANGTLDASFGTNGKVLKNVFISTASTSFAEKLVLQSDGKIVVAANFSPDGLSYQWMLVRFNADGSTDLNYGTQGHIITTVNVGDDFLLTDLAIQPDDKVLAVGYRNPAGPALNHAMMARYTVSGKLDSTFEQDGLLYYFAGSSLFSSLTLQSDGKIVAAGYQNQSGSENCFVVRYTPDGVADISFGTGGKSLFLYANQYVGTVSDVKILANNKILTLGGGLFINPQDQSALVQLNSDGTLDTNFASNGTFMIDLALSSTQREWLYHTAIQPDGKILVGGTALSDLTQTFSSTLIRLTSISTAIDNKEDLSYWIYPNPTQGKFRIANQQGELQIRDIQGKIVLQNENYEGEEISIEALPSGIYMLEMKHNGVRIFSTKLSKI